MTLDRWAASSRRVVAAALIWCAACALPRAGTNEDAGRPSPDASADTGADGATICEPADCNDGNPCTDDLCTATGCQHVPNDSPCDDGVFCNGFDQCADGACQPGSGDPCAAPTVCDEARHSCVGCTADADCPADNVPEWSGCDFGGSACGLEGTRSREVTSYACNLTTHECDATVAPQMEACTRPAADTNGLSCAASGRTGLCEGGACCAGCLDGSTCRAGSTAAACGAGGAACARCGGATPFCVGGSCVECARAADCDDANPCTTDACSGGSCTHANNTGACDDGNACTVGDRCSGGSCNSGPPKDCDDSNACTTDGCNTVSGACTHANNTRSCNDGDACTTGDVCGGGVCGGTPMACGDGNPCTADSCSAGSCQHPAVMDGTGCPGGVCMGGACVAGCASNNDCTDPANARCDLVTNRCVPCGGAAACSHLSGLPNCDLTMGGVCVATCGGCRQPTASGGICYGGNGNTRCGSGGADCVDCAAMGKTCNPGTHTCM